MIEDIKTIKKKVPDDWQRAFKQLTIFSQNKLYKAIGPLITGIDLVNIQRIDGYRPHFVIYPLWGNRMGKDLKACLEGPIILYEFYNKKGLQLNIPYANHNTLFSEAVECANAQISIAFDRDISLKELFGLVDKHLNHILIKSHSGNQAGLYEFKFNAALYVGNNNFLEDVIAQIQKASKNWNMQQFEMVYDNFDIWFQGLQEKIAHRQDFLDQIAANKQDKKLQKLKSSELIP
jgi:hypothetical protein